MQLKLEMLKKLQDKMQPNNVLKTGKMEIQFCGTNTKARTASSTFLPVMIHRCPEKFSTVEYFEVFQFYFIYVWVIPYQIYNQNFDSPENFFPRYRKEKK